MTLSGSAPFVLLSAFLAGAVHVVTPDHWLPASVVAWQRGWSLRRTCLLGAMALAAHLAAGVALFFLVRPLLGWIKPAGIPLFALVLVLTGLALRYLSLSRNRQLGHLGVNGAWGILAILSLLGPSESLLPVMMFSGSDGHGYLLPAAGYAAGTLIFGPLVIAGARIAWNRPYWLPQSLAWFGRRRVVVPIMASLVACLAFVLLRVG